MNKIIKILALIFLLILNNNLYSESKIDKNKCVFIKDGKEYKICGKVKIVNNFEDIKVKIVDNFEDIEIKIDNSYNINTCGNFKIVDNFEDIKIKIVNNFEDIRVRIINKKEIKNYIKK